MSRFNQFLDNAVKNALSAVERQQSPAASIYNAANVAASRVAAAPPVSTPSPLSQMGMANATPRVALPDPVELGRQTAQMIQRNQAQTAMSQLQQRLAQPASTPSPLSAMGMANTTSRPVALPSSQDAMRGSLFGASPMLGVQKAAQAAVGEGIENRPGSSTAASTGQRLSPVEELVVVDRPGQPSVIVPKSRTGSMPDGWTVASTVDPVNADKAKQSPQYIDNQDAQTQAMFPVPTPPAPQATGSRGATQQGQQSGMGGGTSLTAGMPDGTDNDTSQIGKNLPTYSQNPDGTIQVTLDRTAPVSASNAKDETVIVYRKGDPNAQPIIVSEWAYWDHYANDPTYETVGSNPQSVPRDARMETDADIVAQRRAGIAPSPDKGDPNATPDIGDIILDGFGSAGSAVGGAVQSAYDALPDWLKSPIATVGGVAGKVGSTVLDKGLAALDAPRVFTVGTAGDTVYHDTVIGGKVSHDPAVVWVDTMTAMVTNPAGVVWGTDKMDGSFSQYVYENRDEAKIVYEQGYDSDGDGVADYTGGRALWEWYVGTLNPAQRAAVDAAIDPLTWAGGVGAAGERVGGVGRAIRTAEGATKAERVVGGAGEIVGGAMQLPTQIVDKPVDAAIDWGVGKVPWFRQTAESAAQEAKGQATGTVEQVLGRERVDPRTPGGEGGAETPVLQLGPGTQMPDGSITYPKTTPPAKTVVATERVQGVPTELSHSASGTFGGRSFKHVNGNWEVTDTETGQVLYRGDWDGMWQQATVTTYSDGTRSINYGMTPSQVSVSTAPQDPATSAAVPSTAQSAGSVTPQTPVSVAPVSDTNKNGVPSTHYTAKVLETEKRGGSIVTYYDDGSRSETIISTASSDVGEVRRHYPDNTTVVTRPDGSTLIYYPDDSTALFAKGQTVPVSAAPETPPVSTAPQDPATSSVVPDTAAPNASGGIFPSRPSGTTVTLSNGSVAVYQSDGSRIVTSKQGYRTQEWPDGQVRSLPVEGRTPGGDGGTARPAVPDTSPVDGTGNRPPSSAAVPSETAPASAASTETKPVSAVPDDWGAPSSVASSDGVTTETYPNGGIRYVDETTGETVIDYPDGVRVWETPAGEQTIEYRQPDGTYSDVPPANAVPDTLPSSDEVVAQAEARGDGNPQSREATVEAQEQRIDALEGPHRNQVNPQSVGTVFDSSGLDGKAKQIVENINTRTQRNAAADYKMYIGRPDLYPARQEIDIAGAIANDADVIEATAGARVTPNVPPAVGKRTTAGDDARSVLYNRWDDTAAERNRLYQNGSVAKNGKGQARAKRAYVDMVDSHARFVPEDVAGSADFQRAMDTADQLRPTLKDVNQRPVVKEPYRGRRATRGKGNLGIAANPEQRARSLKERIGNRLDDYGESARRNEQASRGGSWTRTSGDSEPTMLRGRAIAPSEKAALNDPTLMMPVDMTSVDRKQKDWRKAWETTESTKPVPSETPGQRFERKAQEYEAQGLSPDEADIRAANDTITDMNEWQRQKYGTRKGKADGAFGAAVSNSIDVYRTMQKMQREAMLTSWFTGSRYVTNQVVGNALTSFITGHGIPLNLADVRREYGGLRGARRAAERGETDVIRAITRDGVTVGDAGQVLTRSDELANKLGYRIRDNVETSVIDMVIEGGGRKTTWSSVVGAGAVESSTRSKVADMATKVISDPRIRDAATASDIYARKYVQRQVVEQRLPGIINDITDEVVRKTDGRVGRKAMRDFVDGKGGAFSQDDLRTFLREQGVEDGQAIRLGRDWQEGVNRAYDEGAKEVKRVMFYGKTQADEVLNTFFNFHYWLVRGSKLYAQEIFTNPALLANYIRLNKGLEKMAEEGGYPDWMIGAIKLASNFFGFNIYVNPMQFVNTLITSRYPSTNPEDVAGWVKVLESTGLMVSGPMATALGMAGYYGDSTPPDPIGLSVVSGPATDVANVVQSQVNPSGGPIADPVAQAMNWVATKTSGNIDGSTKVTPRTGTEAINREINETIITIAEEKGLISADEAERARQAEATGETLPPVVTEAISNPDDPLYQEAYRRVSVKNAGVRAVRATPLGAVYPTVRTTQRDETAAITDRGRAERGGIAGAYDDALSILRTGAPDHGRDPNPKSQVPIDEQVGPSAQPGGMSVKEKALRQYYGGSYGAATGNDTLGQVEDERRLTNAANPESVRLYNEVEQGRKLDQQYYREKQVLDRAQSIQYGDDGVFQPIVVGGQYYSGDQIAAMSSAQRENLAKAWLDDQGMTQRVATYQTKKDALRAGQNPVTQNYYAWRNTTYKTGDQVGYAKQLAQVNPSYGAYYNSLTEEQKQNPGVLFSAEAYIAFTGGQADYNSPSGMKTTDQSKMIADPMSPTGYYSPYTVESKSSSGSSGGSSGSSTPPKTHADDIRGDQAKYERDTALWEWQTTQVLGYVPGPTPTKQEKAILKEAGLDQTPPSKSDYLQDYDFWVTQQQPGSDTSPEAYEQWRLDSGYQEKPVDKDAPPPGTPIGGSAKKTTNGNGTFGDRSEKINALAPDVRQQMIYTSDGALSTFGILLAAEAKRNGYKLTMDGRLVKVAS